MGKFHVVIVIVSYNGMAWLDACLESCKNYAVVVVDNASTDKTLSHIQKNYPDVTLLPQSLNLGFGQANNIGIRYALEHGAAHVFLLNQDAYLIGDVLNTLLAFQKQHPDYGIVSPIHVTRNIKKLDKNFANFMLREKTGQFYSDFVLGNTLAPVYQVPFVNAAGWLLSRKCIETVGGFDPLFFHYGEDDNYCQRVVFHGFKIGVIPNFYIIHDREYRVGKKVKVFSEAYFTAIEKDYKVVYADINKANTIDLKIKKLKTLVLKLKLNLKFERASMYQRELNILKFIKPSIAASRIANRNRGPHYL